MKQDKQIIKSPSLPNRENIIGSQINNLLSIFIQAGNFLVASQIHGPRTDDDGSARGGAIDGGAKCAVETTMINLCDRFDAILKEESRWSLDTQRGLEESVKALYDAQTAALRAQEAAFKESHAPHTKYNPKIVKMLDGSWLAFHGNPADLENALCGVGDCPASALEAFDALFAGQVTTNLREWLNTHTVETNKNEKTILDETGIGNSEGPAQSGPQQS